MNRQSQPLSNFLATLVDQSSLRLARAGDADDILDVPGRPNFIYGELGGVGGARVEIRTSAIHPNVGDSIYIMRENPLHPAGWRHVFWLRDGDDPTLPAPFV